MEGHPPAQSRAAPAVIKRTVQTWRICDPIAQLSATRPSSSPPAPPHTHTGNTPPKGAGKGMTKAARIPEAEYAAITKLKDRDDQGKRLCRWYNCSLGCQNSSCPYSHTCCECGSKHSWASQHR